VLVVGIEKRWQHGDRLNLSEAKPQIPIFARLQLWIEPEYISSGRAAKYTEGNADRVIPAKAIDLAACWSLNLDPPSDPGEVTAGS